MELNNFSVIYKNKLHAKECCSFWLWTPARDVPRVAKWHVALLLSEIYVAQRLKLPAHQHVRRHCPSLTAVMVGGVRDQLQTHFSMVSRTL